MVGRGSDQFWRIDQADLNGIHVELFGELVHDDL